MNNSIILFNRWFNNNSNITIPLIISLVILATIGVAFNKHIILLISSLFLLLLSAIRLLEFKAKFDRSKYDIPEVGEKIVITKGFYWNGEFHRKEPIMNLGNRPWYYTIGDNSEFTIKSVIEVVDDWEIEMVGETTKSTVIRIYYLESRKNWKSLSTIRDLKLKKLGV